MASSDYTTVYQTFTNNLNSIGRAVLIILGSLGALFNLCVFAQRGMRRTPFSIYMIAFNISNVSFLWLSLFPLFINQVLQINPTAYNVNYCRFYYYLSYTIGIICPSYLILAAIDRTLISSPKALTRQKSTRRLALCSVIGVVFVWGLFYCHFWFRINIYLFFNTISLCYFDSGIYTDFVNYSNIVLNGLLPPVIMAICVQITVKNLRSIRTVTTENGNTTTRITQKDRQLIRMSSIEIAIYILCSLLQPIFLCYLIGSTYIVKSAQQRTVETFILSIANFASYIPNCTSFYCNIACSKQFRKQVFDVLNKVNPLKRLVRNQQMFSHTTQARH